MEALVTGLNVLVIVLLEVLSRPLRREPCRLAAPAITKAGARAPEPPHQLPAQPPTQPPAQPLAQSPAQPAAQMQNSRTNQALPAVPPGTNLIAAVLTLLTLLAFAPFLVAVARAVRGDQSALAAQLSRAAGALALVVTMAHYNSLKGV